MQYIRECPKCKKQIIYKSKRTFQNAEKKQTVCKACRLEFLHNDEEIKRKKREKMLGRKNPKTALHGEKNPMFGKTIYEVWIEKYGIEEANIRKEQHANKSKNFGSNNGMYGKSVYDIWLQKYGKEEADKRKQLMNEKQSNSMLGEKNPMFGKPSPIGSGNGWSGHYKNYYFRSLIELSYLKHLLDNNIKFENGELKKYHIPYIINNVNKNYLPDFYLIDTKEIIEIKPKKLIQSYENKLKFTAAKERLGDKFKILTEDEINIIPINNLLEMHNNKEIIFDKGIYEKILLYIEKIKN